MKAGLRPALLLAGALATAAHAQAPRGTRAPGDTATPFVAVDHAATRFVESLAPWQLGALSLGHRSGAGTYIARVNTARRFETGGAQGEVDLYPRLGRTCYAYLNAGYGDAPVFPEWRFGAELFANLPRAWEASLGLTGRRYYAPADDWSGFRAS